MVAVMVTILPTTGFEGLKDIPVATRSGGSSAGGGFLASISETTIFGVLAVAIDNGRTAMAIVNTAINANIFLFIQMPKIHYVDFALIKHTAQS